MDSERSLGEWQQSPPVPPINTQSPFHRLRSSLDNAKQLKEDILRLRRSLSSNCLSNLHLIATLRKNNSSSLLTSKSIGALYQPPKSPLKAKLELIESKLK